ncbi:MAG: lysylphosphatidylglycerol synthase domain-containing protein [Chitinophagales bacterium]
MNTILTNSFFKKNLTRLLKVLIFSGLVLAIYQQIARQKDFEAIAWTFLSSFRFQNVCWLLGVCSFTFVNWGIEAQKWRQLLSKMERLSFKDAFRAILCGITLSLFTPNRVGEYGGRVLILQHANRLQAIAVTLVGSLSQIIANVTLGAIGFLSFAAFYLQWQSWQIGIAVGASILLITALFLVYFQVQKSEQWLAKIPFFRRYKTYFAPIAAYNTPELRQVLGWSFLRNMVFTLQYIGLCWTYNMEVDVWTAWTVVNTIFFVQLFIPSIALIELGIRGNVALFFWGYVTANHLAIIAATFSLWWVNLVMPALVGWWLISRLNILEGWNGKLEE